MTDPIRIPFEGDEADFIASAKKVQSEMDALNAKLKAAGVSQSAYNKVVAESTRANQTHKISLTDLKSGLDLAGQGLRLLQTGYKETVGAAQSYAASVRDLAAISGTGAEESSRLLQVLDDFQIGADDVTAAVKKMTSQGLVPTVDTLAQLSDEYLAIEDPMQRNKFVLDNLGKSGLQWTNVLKQGSVAIRSLSADVNKNLILNDEQIKKTEQYRLALDNLNDTIEGLKVSKGIGFIEELNAGIFQLEHAKEIWAEMNRLRGEGAGGIIMGLVDLNNIQVQAEYNVKLKEGRIAQEEYIEAVLAGRGAMAETVPVLAATEEELKAISEANTSFVSTLQNVASARETFTSGMEEVNAALAAGDISVEEHAAKVGELKGTYEETMNAMVLSMIQFQLAADGAFDADDLNTYLAAGEKLGAWTQGMVTETKRLYNEATKTTESIQQQGDIIYHTGKRAADAGRDLGIMADGAAALEEAVRPATAAVSGMKSQLNGLPVSGTAWQYDFIINVQGQVPKVATASFSTAAGYNTNVHAGEDSGRDSGGPGEPGKVYMIGKGAQPEAFIPNSSGTFIPNADKLFDTSGIISAIQSIPQLDEKRLARALRDAMAQADW